MPNITSLICEIKKTFALGLPLIASQVVYACSGFVSTAMVSHLGKHALAATVLVSMVWMSLSMLFFGILGAASVLVSHQYGAKNYKAISEIMGQCFIVGVLICVLLVIILINMSPLLRFSHQPANVLLIAAQYTHALIWCVPGLITLIICEQFLGGIGRTKVVLWLSLITVPIEIPLIYALVFGKIGLPACGAAGIGYGFAITYTIPAIGMSLYLHKSKAFQPYAIFAHLFTLHWPYIKDLLRVGLPMGIMQVVEISTFTIATFWMAQFGTSMLAAHQLAFQYLGLFIMLVFGMSQAVSIRVGHAVGRQDLQGIKSAVYVGMFANLACIIPLTLVLNLCPQWLLRLDFNIHDPVNTALLQDSTTLLAIVGILLLVDNCRIIGFGALRGLKDTRVPLYISFMAFGVIGLGSAYILGFVYKLGGAGIWWGLTIGIGSGLVMVLWRLRHLLPQLDLAQLRSSASDLAETP